VFFLRSPVLASLGLTQRDDQYSFYLAFFGGIGTYGRLSYKNYLLKAYINEPDPVLKDIIGGRFPFTEAELRGAQRYLDKYKKSPRIWLIIYPLSFLGYEILKKGPRFWQWNN
jgi:hypothetical protein